VIPIAVGLALLAAVLHATWNVLLKSEGDPLPLAVRAVGTSALLSTPFVLAAWLIGGRPGLDPWAWLLAVVSAGVEVLYFLALSEAYRRGDISVVYPIARGTAPVLAVLAGVVILREAVSPLEIVGIALLITGMWIVNGPVAFGPAVRPALLTGCCIATYTTIDGAGVHLGPPWLYGWVMWACTAMLLVGWTRRRTQEHRYAETEAPSWKTAAIVGWLMILAYLLVLIALRIAPLVVVAPLRESAVVLVAGWGLWRLRERGTVVRLAGAVLIVSGIAVVALR
jgi:drug/metabolite transporter (DMT)-like permease